MIRLMVTSGRGPAECRLAVAHVLEAMTREAEAQTLDLGIALGSKPDRHGPGSAVVVLEGETAEAFAKGWSGSILWVARSPIRPNHGRKNWFVGVFELPAPPKPPSSVNLADVRFEAMRAGGPGGQHQNKTESAVRAVHAPTGLTIVCREGRSQHRNRQMALSRLAELIELQGVLAEEGDRMLLQSHHDALERGNPIRRYEGPEFRRVKKRER